ncbi:GNAT family N-acetyltransferase [Lachnospiraceae bacterium JLR.KK008]
MLQEIIIKNGNRVTEEGVLYLTDDLKLLKALKREGKAVAAVLTDENRGEDFSGIPYAVECVEELEEQEITKIYRRLTGLPWEILETDRCRLREMTVGDLDRLYEIYDTADTTQYMEGLSGDREEERAYIKDYCKYMYGFHGYGIWLIEEKTAGVVIGRAGIEPGEDGTELGYMIAAPWRRKGYAFEVCSAVLDYTWREIGCHEVICRIRHGNRASAGLLKKLGFGEGETDRDGMEKYTKSIPVDNKNPQAEIT